MGFAPRAFLAGGLGFAVSLLAACGGGSGLLSSNQANNLNSQLDQVSAAVKARQCAAAANAITTFSNSVIDLPPAVSPTLTRNLEQGASTVALLAARECQLPAATTATTTSSSSSSSTSSTTTTAPTTTTTQSTSTQTGNPATSTSPPSTTATSQTSSGTTSTDSGSGGAGLGGGGTGGAAGSGGGNGNGNGQ